MVGRLTMQDTVNRSVSMHVLEIEPRAPQVLGKCAPAELRTGPSCIFLFSCFGTGE